MADILDTRTGNSVADAINKRILSVAQEVYKNAPANQTRYGRVVSHKDGLFTVTIDNAQYTSVPALRNIGNVEKGEVVICLIPNNQFNNMVILGVADGTLQGQEGQATWGNIVGDIDNQTDLRNALLAKLSTTYSSRSIGWDSNYLNINSRVKIIGNTGDTALHLQSNTAASYIALDNANGATLGYFGVSANREPVFYDTTDHILAYYSDLSTKMDIAGGTFTGIVKFPTTDGGCINFTDGFYINREGGSTLLGSNNTTNWFGLPTAQTLIRGNGTRPKYNGGDLALYSDLSSLITADNILAGTNISVSKSGNDVTISAAGSGAAVTSVVGQSGDVTAAQIISACLTGAVNYGNKITDLSMSASNTFGHIKFNNGLIIQWGAQTFTSSSYGGSNGVTVTFSSPFTSSTSFGISATWNNNSSNNNLTKEWNIKNKSNTQFTFVVNSQPGAALDTQICWIAIGF